MAFDRESLTERWAAGGHCSRDAMGMLRMRVESYVTDETGVLPGHGIRDDDQIALYSMFILVGGERLAWRTDRHRAAAAIRRLADIVEAGKLSGVGL